MASMGCSGCCGFLVYGVSLGIVWLVCDAERAIGSLGLSGSNGLVSCCCGLWLACDGLKK